MNARKSLIVAAVAAAALTGCSSTPATSSATPGGTVPAAPASTAGSPAAGGTAAESSAAPATSTRNSADKPAADSACTPAEATLLEALRSSKIGDDLAPTDTLTDITCHKGYALAETHPKEADNAEVVFHYTDGAWRAVNGGTSGYCDDVVPAAVRPYLKRC